MSIQENTITPTDNILHTQASLTCSAEEYRQQANLIQFALHSLKQDILESMQEENSKTCRNFHKKDSIDKIERIKAEYHVTTEELLRVANLAIEENQNRCPSACRHSYRHVYVSKPSKLTSAYHTLLIVLIILLIILSLFLMAIYIKHTTINHRQKFLKEKSQISQIINPEDKQLGKV